MFKHTIDWTMVATAWGSFIGLLPPLAALASLIWTLVQLYEWYKKRRNQNAAPTEGV